MLLTLNHTNFDIFYFYVLLVKNIFLYSLRITFLSIDNLEVRCLISKYLEFSRCLCITDFWFNSVNGRWRTLCDLNLLSKVCFMHKHIALFGQTWVVLYCIWVLQTSALLLVTCSVHVQLRGKLETGVCSGADSAYPTFQFLVLPLQAFQLTEASFPGDFGQK